MGLDAVISSLGTEKIDSVQWSGNWLTLLPGLMLCSATTQYPALIDKQLSIHYSYSHMIHLPFILETFEPVSSNPPYNHYSRKSISIFAVPKMHVSCIFYSLWLL